MDELRNTSEEQKWYFYGFFLWSFLYPPPSSIDLFNPFLKDGYSNKDVYLLLTVELGQLNRKQ